MCQQQKPDWRSWFTPELMLAGFYYELHRYAEAEPYAEQVLELTYEK